MASRKKITFGAFTMDVSDELLWKGKEKIHLRPKTFALLRCLVTQPHRLIAKEELMNTIWRDCHVGEEALKHCVTEIRKALGDRAETPHFIETVHRRGYRFIGKFSLSRRNPGEKEPTYRIRTQSPQPKFTPFVGRQAELAELKQYLERAENGSRRIVFISGEQGIGKTSLVDAFLETASAGRSAGTASDMRIARGQCIQAHGTSEAYMPCLEALTELCRKSGGKSVTKILRRHAPLWISQMPSLLSTAQLQKIRNTTRDATRERMLRELAEALEELTSDKTLILILEDLHWSDHSTLNWLLFWAQRRRSSRMLLIATYRPAEAMVDDHPLKNIRKELLAQQLCHELILPYLNETSIGEYLSLRFPDHAFPARTAPWIRQRTGGNPLFIANILNHLSELGHIVKHNKLWTLDTPLEKIEQSVPPTIRQIVDRQIEHCTEREQLLLQAASVKGMEFSVAGAAAALNEKEDAIELLCRNLAAHSQFLQPVQDRTISRAENVVRYRFMHALYRNICYQIIPAERRIRFHRRIAAFLEHSDNGKTQELYTQLAMHYGLGREYKRAVRYYRKAVDNANARYAGHEALELATKGLQLLELVPLTSIRLELEIRLQNALGTALMSVEGLGNDKAVESFRRARELFRKLSPSLRSRKKPLLFQSLYGLWTYHWVNAEYVTAKKLAEHLVELAKTSKDPHLKAQSHYALGIILMDHGEYAAALDHLRQGSGVICRCCAEIARWHVGYPDQSLNTIQEILAYAMETRNTESILFAHLGTARVNMARGEYELAKEHAQAAMKMALNQGMSEPWLTPMRIIHGWGEAKSGKRKKALQEMSRALTVFRNIETSNLKPLLFALYADILLEASRLKEGLSVVEEALEASHSTGMHHYDAELHRLKGELLMTGADGSDRENPGIRDAEDCFRKAERVARRQQAKSLELRAATSLARLRLLQGRGAEAHPHLKKIYDWFTEGRDTADLERARELLKKGT